MTIKAIETEYKGYKFRSRLEVRWAIFFDALDIEWEYEPERFEKFDWQKGTLSYLPDFYLPKTKTWVEVKGDKYALCEDYERMSKLLNFGSCLPDFDDSDGTNHGLLLLGDIPSPDDYDMFFHPIIQHCKGLHRNWITFDNMLDGFQVTNVLYPLEQVRYIEDSPEGWKVETKGVILPHYSVSLKLCRVKEAYKKAWQARFVPPYFEIDFFKWK